MIYMDNGATSFPKAPGTAAAMAAYLETVGANAGRGAYPSAVAADEMLLETRRALGRLFRFPFDDHVIFTSGATAGLNLVLNGFIRPGDRVAVTGFEHNAVMRPLYRAGARITILPFDENGATAAEKIEDALPEDVRMVVATGASNVCGTLQPLGELGEICRRRSIPFLVDGAQIAGHISVDMEALHITALAVPAHKGLLGPQGVGAVLIHPELASVLKPLIYGGTGSHSRLRDMPPVCPDRFEAGTGNLPGIAGWKAALDFVEKTGIDTIRQASLPLMERFLTGVLQIRGVRLVGTDDPVGRVDVFALDFTEQDNDLCAHRLQQRDIAVRSGLHCAPLAHESLGTVHRGLVRFSFSYFTEEAEIDAVLSAIKQQAE